MVKYSREPENVSKSAKVRNFVSVCPPCSFPSPLSCFMQAAWACRLLLCIVMATGPHANPVAFLSFSASTHAQARGSDLRVHFKNTREVRASFVCSRCP
jgi:hypothetical protein